MINENKIGISREEWMEIIRIWVEKDKEILRE